MDLTITFQTNRNSKIPVTLKYIKQYKADQNKRRDRQTTSNRWNRFGIGTGIALATATSPEWRRNGTR